MYYIKYFLYCKKSETAYDSVMAKMGRPSKAKKERRSQLITLRLTTDEVKAIDKAATQAGEDRSEWARKTLLAAANVLQ
jgi:hypothetical protein